MKKLTTQIEVSREIDRLIDLAIKAEDRRNDQQWESKEFWRLHDLAIKYHERARKLMSRGS